MTAKHLVCLLDGLLVRRSPLFLIGEKSSELMLQTANVLIVITLLTCYVNEHSWLQWILFEHSLFYNINYPQSSVIDTSLNVNCVFFTNLGYVVTASNLR